MKKHVAEMFVTLLVGAMAVGLQNSKTWAANSGTDQPKSGTVEQLLMQMERDWGRAIVDRNIVKIREIVAADVVLTTPDGTAFPCVI